MRVFSLRGALSITTTSAALLMAVLPAMAAAEAAPALPSVTIACGDVTGLKAAIVTANGGGPSTIVLAPNCVYTLTSAVTPVSPTQGAVGLPIVTRTVHLVGLNTTIQRVSSSNFRIAEVAGSGGNSATLTIEGITLRGGRTSGVLFNAGLGGCLLASYTGLTPTNATLVVAKSKVEGCAAFSGGGIYADSHASLEVTDSLIAGNSATLGGGGVYVHAGGRAEITKTFLTDNSATVSGGALYNAGDASVTSVTVNDNHAAVTGGGIYSSGALFLGAAFVTLNGAIVGGGGIYIADGGGPPSADVSPGADAALVAVRLEQNTALGFGGGLANFGDTRLQNSFVTINIAPLGGGVFQGSTGGVTNLNTLIFGNTLNNCRPLGSVAFCVN